MSWYTYTDRSGEEHILEQCGICGTNDSEGQPHYAKGLCESCYQKWIRSGKDRFPDFKPIEIVRRTRKRASGNMRRCAFCTQPEITIIFGTSLCEDHIEEYKMIVTAKQTSLSGLFVAT